MTRDTGQRADTASKVDPASGEHHGSYETTAHTPGPWSVERCYVTRPEPDLKVTAGYLHIAEVSYSDNPEHTFCTTDVAVLRANARLIAAAPDLVEVLREIIADGVHCDVVPHLHRKAVAALAKATGESA